MARRTLIAAAFTVLLSACASHADGRQPGGGRSGGIYVGADVGR